MDARLLQLIQDIDPLPTPIAEELCGHFQHLELPKGYFLHRQGKVCQHIWFMFEGAVRYFHVDVEGREANVWFAFDTDILSDAPSMVSGLPSAENIQLLEDSIFFAIEYVKLKELMAQHHSLALWYIRLVERFYVVQIEERIGDLQFLNARQRYDKLLTQFPAISNRLSLGQIASYLNITPETLSRIRSGKA